MKDFTQYAGFGRRAAGLALDLILFGAVSELVLYFLYGPAYYQWLLKSVGAMQVYGAGQIVVNQILPAVLTVLLWIKLKGTPGKLLLSCVVVDANTHMRINFAQALIRYFGYIVSMIPLGLGFLWVLWDPRRQGFHDKIAGTVVLIEDEADKSIAVLMQEMH